ncbi:MAG: hypothetical protein ACT4OZ_14845 [Gemmatimonadota bacterium]
MMSVDRIIRLFELLDGELAGDGLVGELYVVGGAVMCLVHRARPSTADVDAYFLPARAVREAARRVAVHDGVDQSWLNDGVKAWFAANGDYEAFLELPNLKVMTASSQYLLAMKCLAMRLGEEFHDLDDVRFLIRSLNLETEAEVLAVIGKYYPLERFPAKTLFAIKDILPSS